MLPFPPNPMQNKMPIIIFEKSKRLWGIPPLDSSKFQKESLQFSKSAENSSIYESLQEFGKISSNSIPSNSDSRFQIIFIPIPILNNFYFDSDSKSNFRCNQIFFI